MTKTGNPSPQPLRRSTRKRKAPEKFNPTDILQPKISKLAKQDNQSKNKLQNKKTTNRKKKGLAGTSPINPSAPLGVVDPASNINGNIYTYKDSDGVDVVYDVMMVMVNPSRNIDKFYVLQLIKSDHSYFLYQRWGRTGTSGSSLTISFGGNEIQKALNQFENKFSQKTGLSFEQRDEQPIPGKYRNIRQDFSAKSQWAHGNVCLWQYWVDDGVDGKATGWYNYDPSGNILVEQLSFEYQQNPNLSSRIVQSGTYSYLVNLQHMTQQNVIDSNHKIRQIRRVSTERISLTNFLGTTNTLNVNSDGNDDDGDSPNEDENNHSGFNSTSSKKGPSKVVLQQIDPNVQQLQHFPTEEDPQLKKVESSQIQSQNLQMDDTMKEIIIPVDSMLPNADTYEVFDNLDATLNQSNIMHGSNNNKFYRIQGIKKIASETYYVWMRWGRVGESVGSQTKLEGPFRKKERAVATFEKKFSAKTGNKWSERESFEQKSGKYDLVLIDHTPKEENNEPLIITQKANNDIEYEPSTLPKQTKNLIELLFHEDVYTDALREFDIDVNRMPLGNLSKKQVERGVAVLEEIEEILNQSPSNRTELARLSSKFYTTLPHDFGRRRPPVISDKKMLQRCYDMCNVLSDMETATDLMAKAEKREEENRASKVKLPHPTDEQYTWLNADLKLVEHGSEEHNIIIDAWKQTQAKHDNSKLLNIWRVDRHGEGDRFKSYNKLDNHMLLWHGTHIGAVSAILSTGLRIMPHSGGRVGRGIYLASEHGKSIDYTSPAYERRTGCMFLVEAALGKTHEIFHDAPNLKRAPKGFNSVRACGNQSPSGCEVMEIDGNKVNVHVKAPKPLAKAKNSSFYQDEYLIYEEPQARLRYVITFHM